ncbi:MAG: alpha/beta hydrolase [Alphaproteobacteria bacterium]|nr:MAG: alpha/beta hydrolase [Alphaproteobacteria bacterium]TAF16089.1 MAG: alpha/beta hydrolase [Alphaproteobacteria bacterium]TAF75903.1 MAG: alpha/beta hydrolase [Alphaproteobacteria bacterium]
MNAITSHYHECTIDGLEPVCLHYRTAGDPKNPVILCIHALTGNAHDFDILAQQLATDYYVIALDMPGRGNSTHLENKDFYSNPHHLLWTFHLLDALHIDHLFAWIGASMGGIMGMMVWAFRPHFMDRLMLNDIGAVLAHEGLQAIISSTSSPLPTNDPQRFEALMRDYAQPFHITDEEHWKLFFASRVMPHHEGGWQLKRDPAVVEPLKAWIHATPMAQDISLEAVWEQVQCPTLIFRGEESLLFRADTAEAMAARTDIPVRLYTIPHAGHMPNLMDAYQCAMIHAWLREPL